MTRRKIRQKGTDGRMFEENDYIMRMIHEAIRMLVKMVLGIDLDKREEAEVEKEIEERYRKLTALADEGKINEAENLLVDGLDAKNKQDFQLALFFYEHLNRMDNEFLEKSNFSRQEVADGVRYVVSMYGYGSMMEAFLEDYE